MVLGSHLPPPSAAANSTSEELPSESSSASATPAESKTARDETAEEALEKRGRSGTPPAQAAPETRAEGGARLPPAENGRAWQETGRGTRTAADGGASP